MDCNSLMMIAENYGIMVYNFRMAGKKAFAVLRNIALDYSRIETEREHKRLLSEEIGHCVIQALYSLSDCNNPTRHRVIAKAERKATDYSYNLQVPLKELQEALKKSDDDYEIAEMLDVDIDTLRQAVDYYRRKNLL